MPLARSWSRPAYAAGVRSVINCSAIGRNSVDATNARRSRAVFARRCANVSRCRRCLLVAFLDLAAVLWCAVLLCVVELVSLVVCPEIAPAATSKHSIPPRQALLNLEGKSGEILTLIHPM